MTFRGRTVPENQIAGDRIDYAPETFQTWWCCGVGSRFLRKSFHPWFKSTQRERETWRSLKAKPSLSVSKGQKWHSRHTHFIKLLPGNEMKFLEVTRAVCNEKKKVWHMERQGGLFTTWKAGKRRERKRRLYSFQNPSWNEDVRTIFLQPLWPTWLSFRWLSLVRTEQYLLKSGKTCQWQGEN